MACTNFCLEKAVPRMEHKTLLMTFKHSLHEKRVSLINLAPKKGVGGVGGGGGGGRGREPSKRDAIFGK